MDQGTEAGGCHERAVWRALNLTAFEPSDRLACVPVEEAWLPLMAEVEKTAYSHPWSLRLFQDSMRSGHWMRAWVMTPDPQRDPPAWVNTPTLPDGRWLLGYLVAMTGVEETHLLNITTVPSRRRCGHGRQMMQALIEWSRQQGAATLWLEVRVSNTPALALYEAMGFERVGLRKGYYPDAGARREDAVVMKCDLQEDRT